MHDWARSDQAHLTTNDIPKLWQLVETSLAHKLAEAGDARIIRQLAVPFPLSARDRISLQQLHQPFLRVGHHRAKLQTTEGAPILANPYMPKKDRPWVADPSYNSQDYHQWQKEQHPEPGEG